MIREAMKVIDIRQGEIRSTIRRSFNCGLLDCRNVVVIFEGKNGGLYVDWSSVDVEHSLSLIRKADHVLRGTHKDRA